MFIIILALAVCLVGLILANNIYNSLYPPLFTAPVIDVKRVLERIKQAGLTPVEARYYRVIEKDRRGNENEINKPDGALPEAE
jgi:fumarylacetoacetate (FAA) hydrolase family protein